jgi:acetoin utilization deacetylase AcuC-like enzyme
MKPFRLTLTNELVLGYGLHDYMSVYSPRKATSEEITQFHSQDYIDYLSRYVCTRVEQPKILMQCLLIGSLLLRWQPI